jgi:3-oxoacyl-[acyl-carrier protein] reductase
MKLAGRVAIVTGASSGIGRASALLFAAEGARVIAADVDDAGGKETVSAIARNGGEANFVYTDVSQAPDVERLVKTARERFSRIDILLNVAGIYMRRTAVESIEESLWDRIYGVNVKGAFLGARYVVPEMKGGGGAIINIASMAAVRPSAGLSAYASSKGAVITLTRALAVELAPHSIRVNCICPALTDTPMIKMELEDMKRAGRAFGPPGGLNKPEDIAGVALFLASDESKRLNGTCLEVGGGQMA